MTEKTKRIRFVRLLVVIGLLLVGSIGAFAKSFSWINVNKNQNEEAIVLSDIDYYQERYFEIIKRNDLLFSMENNKTLKKDRKELNNLFKEVKKQITNDQYLKKYNDIKKRYAKCNEITDVGMSDFAQRHYNEVDNLLNEVYKAVKPRTLPQEYKQLAKSEANWLKDVEDYEKVLDSMGYGTIGKLIYYDYQISVKEFRTLLLMLYL